MTTAGLRRLLAALLILGIAGLLVDLFLLGHTESFTQLIPFGVMLAGLVLVAAAELHPTANVIRALQAVMVLFVIAGVLGLVLHYKGNVEFELERDSSLRGLQLFWESLRGATPSLAPAALAQLGLLGLVYSYIHPPRHRTD